MVDDAALLAARAGGPRGGYYAITTWLPTFLRTERHITVVGSLSYLLVVTLGSFFGYIVSAYSNDIIGRRLNFVLFAIGSGSIVVLYTPPGYLGRLDAATRVFRSGFSRLGYSAAWALS